MQLLSPQVNLVKLDFLFQWLACAPNTPTLYTLWASPLSQTACSFSFTLRFIPILSQDLKTITYNRLICITCFAKSNLGVRVSFWDMKIIFILPYDYLITKQRMLSVLCFPFPCSIQCWHLISIISEENYISVVKCRPIQFDRFLFYFCIIIHVNASPNIFYTLIICAYY